VRLPARAQAKSGSLASLRRLSLGSVGPSPAPRLHATPGGPASRGPSGAGATPAALSAAKPAPALAGTPAAAGGAGTGTPGTGRRVTASGVPAQGPTPSRAGPASAAASPAFALPTPGLAAAAASTPTFSRRGSAVATPSAAAGTPSPAYAPSPMAIASPIMSLVAGGAGAQAGTPAPPSTGGWAGPAHQPLQPASWATPMAQMAAMPIDFAVGWGWAGPSSSTGLCITCMRGA
jgi:hypothetical protein